MTAQQLKQARQRLGLTQAAMANAMGIGTRKLERWEGGHSPISQEGARLVEMLLERASVDSERRISHLDGVN